MRRYADSVGCVGVVRFLWCACVISERAQPFLTCTLGLDVHVVNVRTHTRDFH